MSVSTLCATFVGANIRPRISVRARNRTFSFLFDTGAAHSCLTKRTFDIMNSVLPLTKIDNGFTLMSASHNQLRSIGRYRVPLELKGRSMPFDFVVLENLNDDIIGVDFMHLYQLHYDPVNRRINIANESLSTITTTSEQILPPLSVLTIPARFTGPIPKKALAIVTVFNPTSQLIQGGPALISLDKFGNCLIPVSNSSPTEIRIARKQTIALIEFEDDSRHD